MRRAFKPDLAASMRVARGKRNLLEWCRRNAMSHGPLIAFEPREGSAISQGRSRIEICTDFMPIKIHWDQRFNFDANFLMGSAPAPRHRCAL